MSTRDELAEEYIKEWHVEIDGMNYLCKCAFKSGWNARNPEVEALKKQIEEIADMFCINDMCECGTCRAKVFRAGWMKEEQVKR